MTTLKQLDPLIINSYVTDVFPYPPHSHTYYELIYIFKGLGSHFLNHIQFKYTSGDLFLIAPDDSHHFQIEQPTHFVIVKFTEQLFDKNPQHLMGIDADASANNDENEVYQGIKAGVLSPGQSIVEKHDHKHYEI
jgi:cupin superfamily acireductone dioxygenase involved in methionine salvage